MRVWRERGGMGRRRGRSGNVEAGGGGYAGV